LGDVRRLGPPPLRTLDHRARLCDARVELRDHLIDARKGGEHLPHAAQRGACLLKPPRILRLVRGRVRGGLGVG
jgi:hypothetical protein